MIFTPRYSPAASTNEGVEDHDKRNSNSPGNQLQLYLYAKENFHE
jgi:hypothetical protein